MCVCVCQILNLYIYYCSHYCFVVSKCFVTIFIFVLVPLQKQSLRLSLCQSDCLKVALTGHQPTQLSCWSKRIWPASKRGETSLDFPLQLVYPQVNEMIKFVFTIKEIVKFEEPRPTFSPKSSSFPADLSPRMPLPQVMSLPYGTLHLTWVWPQRTVMSRTKTSPESRMRSRQSFSLS